MSQTEKIEKYLLGELSSQEVKAFEQELVNNAELRQELELQEAITKRVQRMAFLTALDSFDPKMDIDSNNQSQSSGGQGGNFLLKTIIGTIAVIILGISAYFYFTPIDKTPVITKSGEPLIDTNTVKTKSDLVNIDTSEVTITEKISHSSHDNKLEENIVINQSKNDKIVEEEKVIPFVGNIGTTQKFEINDFQKLNIITTKGGAKIFIPTSIIDQTKYSSIRLEIIEYLDFDLMLYRMLSSVNTENQPLKTDGIIQIRIVDAKNGKAIKLEHDLKVYIPKKHLKKEQCLTFMTQQQEGKVQWKEYIPEKLYSSVEKLKATSLVEAMKAMQEEEVIKTERKEVQNKYHILFSNASYVWLNAGLPISEDFEKTVNIQINSSLETNLRLMIQGTSTIVAPIKKRNKYVFENIPENATVIIYGIGQVKGKDIYKIAKITIKAGVENKELIYSQTSKENLLTFIKNIDR